MYRGFDAATAKPTPADRERVPHWLVDVADPRTPYTMADYIRDADAAIRAIASRGGVPVVVGGTGMYLRGLLKGIVEAPLPDPELRARLRGMAARFGTPRLHRLLLRLDPIAAARILPGDTQRVTRALELALPNGETWSARLARWGTWGSTAERYPALKFGLDLDRETLAARLAARVQAFFAAGLSGEVERLLASGVPETANAFLAIGYREVMRARLEGGDPEATKDAVVAATRRYAKRQRTWFRREPGLTWLDAALGADALAEIVESAWRTA